MPPLADDDSDKWDYTLHTRLKHEILTKYIDGWIRIAGLFKKMYYYDCFAGRGKYNKRGEEICPQLGSPILVMKHMQKYVPKGIYFNCISVEKNQNNYANLVSVCNREKIAFPDVQFENPNSTFEEYINQNGSVLTIADRYPSFFFIDPFGFKVPFNIVSKLCHSKHAEILVTFMSKNMARFLDSERHSDAIDHALGGPFDHAILDLGLEARQEALVEIYKNNLCQHAKYVMSYRLKESDANITIYHLIHASNYFEAFKLMKDILFNIGASGTITFHGPKESVLKDQLRLDHMIDEANFKPWLVKQCTGKTISFWDLMKETYDRTIFIAPHYRKAIKELAEEKIIKLTGAGPRGGIKDETIIIFPNDPKVQSKLF